MCALFMYSACLHVPGHMRKGVGDLRSAKVRDEVTLVLPMGKLRFRVYGPNVGAHSWNPGTKQSEGGEFSQLQLHSETISKYTLTHNHPLKPS